MLVAQNRLRLSEKGGVPHINQIGVSGQIKDYDVIILTDTVIVLRNDHTITKQTVKGLQKFVAKAKDLRIGWARFPDFEVIYLYDKKDKNFGYAINLQDEWCSEWGYAPFH